MCGRKESITGEVTRECQNPLELQVCGQISVAGHQLLRRADVQGLCRQELDSTCPHCRAAVTVEACSQIREVMN